MIRISDGVPQHHDEEAIHKEVTNVVTKPTIIKNTGLGAGCLWHLLREDANFFFTFDGMYAEAKSTTTTFNGILAAVNFATMYIQGTDTRKSIGAMTFVKWINENKSSIWISVINDAFASVIPLKIHHDKLELSDIPIKNIKNHAHSALSGVRKLIELDIGGVPYYFEVYPTKA